MSEEDKDALSVQELQPKLAKWLWDAHQMSYRAFGAEGRFSNGVVRDSAQAKAALSELASATINDFSTMYDHLPEGHHLEIGLPPQRYYDLVKDEEVKMLCRTDTTDSGPQYWLMVGRNVRSTKGMAPGTSTLNIQPIGTNDPENPKIRFDLVFASSSGFRNLSPSIYPEEILALRVIPNGLPAVK